MFDNRTAPQSFWVQGVTCGVSFEVLTKQTPSQNLSPHSKLLMGPQEGCHTALKIDNLQLLSPKP